MPNSWNLLRKSVLIKLEVSYKRKEYVVLLKDFGDYKHPEAFEKLYSRVLLWIGSNVTFFVKNLRIGACQFEISECSITRISKRGTLVKSWTDVNSVLEFGDIYLIESNKGSMPIPKRVLTSENDLIFKQYIGDRLIAV
ncbi:hypothetical protein CW749_22915 [Vibrio sp. vnigr-6D03]|nr:hypothetical protein CW749_22915 [Vibrio sp. vnigr-6D03]